METLNTILVSKTVGNAHPTETRSVGWALPTVSSARTRRRHHAAGFTLIELLLVLVILAILAAIVVPKFAGRAEQAKQSAAKTDISNLKTALNTFEIDNGRYPSTQEGLQALVSNPGGNLTGWKKPYIEKLPKDPWGHDYIYRTPGTGDHDYDLLSGGPDGQEGGNDDID